MHPDWQKLIDVVAPAAGALVAGGHGARDSAFWGSYQQEKAQMEAEQQRKAAQDLLKQQAGAQYLVQTAQHAQSLPDPVQALTFLNVAEPAGVSAGYIQPGAFDTLRQGITSQTNTGRIKEVAASLADLEKGQEPDYLDKLAQAGAHLTLKSGEVVPIAAALQLTNSRALDATGATIPKVNKPSAAGMTMDERLAALQGTIRTATAKGDIGGAMQAQAQYQDIIKAKRDVATPPVPRAPATGAEGQLNDLMTLASPTATAEEKAAAQQRVTLRPQAARALDKPPSDAGAEGQLNDMMTLLSSTATPEEKAAAQQRVTLRPQAARALDRPSAAQVQAGTPVPTYKPGSAEYKVAEDMAYGKITSTFFRSLTAYSRDTNKKLAIYKLASDLNPNFDQARFEAGFKLFENPQMRQRVVAITALGPIIDKIQTLSTQVPRGNVQIFNQLLQGAKLQVSNSKVVNFNQLKTLLGDEVGLALGLGSGSDLKTRMGVDLINTNLSDGSFQSAMDQIQSVLEARRAELVKTFGIYGTTPGASGGDAAAGTASTPAAPVPTLRFNPATGKVEPVGR